MEYCFVIGDQSMHFVVILFFQTIQVWNKTLYFCIFYKYYTFVYTIFYLLLTMWLILVNASIFSNMTVTPIGIFGLNSLGPPDVYLAGLA